MNTPAVWIILLGIWVFVLQSRVKKLEEMLEDLRFSKKSEPNNLTSLEIDATKIEARVEQTVTESEEEALEALSDVEVFKQTHTSPQQKVPLTKKPSKIMTFISEYFTGGNLLVRIGGVVLFFGLAFLVKYAAEHSVISMEVRLWAIAMTAVILMILGWRLRDREGAYGQILQGLGIAMLYLVIYGAAKFYAMLSLDIAFMLMLGVVLLGSILAVTEDALPLALFSTAGGFLVPILTSSGEGSHVVLFSYYAFLNVGVFIVAWYRSWRILNVVGFLFTFVIAGAWGILKYNAGYFSSTEPFLILYFLMYLFIAIVFTVKHPYEPKNLVDGTLVFGLPVVAFPLQLHLVQNISYADAYSAVVLGVVYLSLWFWLKQKEHTQLLSQSFLALAVVFFTIAIPYIFGADVSAALWSLEASGAIWIGLKQGRKITRYFGMLLLTVSLFAYPDDVGMFGVTVAEYLGYLIVILAAFIAAYLLNTSTQELPRFDAIVAKGFVTIAILWWFGSSVDILSLWYTFTQSQDILLVLLLGAVILYSVTHFITWPLLVSLLQGYLPLALLIFLIDSNDWLLHIHPFKDWGALLFALLFTLHFIMLYRYKTQWKYANALHLLGLWFMVLIGTLETHYHAAHAGFENTTLLLTWASVALVTSILLLIPGHYKGWLENYRKQYQYLGAGVLLLGLILWEVSMFSVAGQDSQGYVPLVNLLDIMQVLVLVTAGYWVYLHQTYVKDNVSVTLFTLLGLLGLALSSVIFARAIHAYYDIPYTMFDLWHSTYFQTGLSLLWSIIAILLMLLSKRYASRGLWLAGFGLLIVVVLKLFFVELASSGTIERIVSFMVVGGLLLVIGYFVPLPPSQETKHEDDTNAEA